MSMPSSSEAVATSACSSPALRRFSALRRCSRESDPQLTSSLNIPTGVPLIYTLDSDLKVVGSEYLGDPDEIAAAAAAVAAQGTASDQG